MKRSSLIGRTLETYEILAPVVERGDLQNGEVAGRLATSERTLHRRLSERGESFRSLVDATRRHVAESLLRDGHYSATEVAFLTGFSEQSAFNRAFKRWTGRTPTAYRTAALE